MEDAVTRQHAQYLVAAALAVGARVVGQALEHARTRPLAFDLHAAGLRHDAAAVSAVQRSASEATRAALREEPIGVLVQPVENGYRVRVLLPPTRAPLQPHELTDIQVAWQRAQERALATWSLDVQPDAERGVAGRRQEAREAVRAMEGLQARVMHGRSDLQPELADAMNRAQMATDAWREAQQRAAPQRFSLPVHSDVLVFRVQAKGLERLPLVQGDEVLRDQLARAAGLSNPAELRVTVRPTGQAGEVLARVHFNLRHEQRRGPEHLDPGSLSAAIMANAVAVPAQSVRAGAWVVPVAVTSIREVVQPERVPASEGMRGLPQPEVVRAVTPEAPREARRAR